MLHSKSCKWAGVIEESSNFGAACKPCRFCPPLMYPLLWFLLFLECSQFLQCFCFFQCSQFLWDPALHTVLNFQFCLLPLSYAPLCDFFFSCAFSVLWQAFLSVLCPFHSIWLGNLVLGLLVISCFLSHVLLLRFEDEMAFVISLHLPARCDNPFPFRASGNIENYWATVPVPQRLDWEPLVSSRFSATELGHEQCVTKLNMHLKAIKKIEGHGMQDLERKNLSGWRYVVGLSILQD